MKELASGAAVAIAVFGTGPYVVGMLRPDQAARVYLACLDGNDDDRLRRAARRERRHRRSRRGCFGACWRGDQRLCVLAGGSALTRDSTGYVLQALLSHSSPGDLPAARLPLSF